MVLSTEEIKKIIDPIARKYELKAVYLFGSYARQEATDSSDVDILIDRADSKIKSLFDMGELYNELSSGIGKEVDIVTVQSLEQKSTLSRTPYFAKTLYSERVKIYE